MCDGKKGKVYVRANCGHQVRAYPSFYSMKWLGVFLLPLDRMLVHRRVTRSIKFAGTHLYTRLERGNMRVKCLAQKHNTMSLAGSQTQTARSGVERTNHEATTPLNGVIKQFCHIILLITEII